MVRRFPAGRYFNPRSPDGERPTGSRHHTWGMAFQSTLPGWGATPVCGIGIFALSNFNPRSPDGERPFNGVMSWSPPDFNPRSPDGERRSFTRNVILSLVFQSTLPGWGATRRFRPRSPRRSHFNPRSPDGERLINKANQLLTQGISIHAPRMGSDDFNNAGYTFTLNFNPRSPDGERREPVYCRLPYDQFQSTLPGWGATTYQAIRRA